MRDATLFPFALIKSIVAPGIRLPDASCTSTVTLQPKETCFSTRSRPVDRVGRSVLVGGPDEIDVAHGMLVIAKSVRDEAPSDTVGRLPEGIVEEREIRLLVLRARVEVAELDARAVRFEGIAHERDILPRVALVDHEPVGLVCRARVARAENQGFEEVVREHHVLATGVEVSRTAGGLLDVSLLRYRDEGVVGDRDVDEGPGAIIPDLECPRRGADAIFAVRTFLDVDGVIRDLNVLTLAADSVWRSIPRDDPVDPVSIVLLRIREWLPALIAYPLVTMVFGCRTLSRIRCTVPSAAFPSQIPICGLSVMVLLSTTSGEGAVTLIAAIR